MAGMTVPATGVQTRNGGGGNGSGRLSQKQLNDYRITAAIDSLCKQLYNNHKNDEEFGNICLSLSRGIDYSIANRETPSRSGELAYVIKQVCQLKVETETPLQACIMVLMVAVKSACQIGFFPEQDSKELINLANKVASDYCDASHFNTEPNPSHPVVSAVLKRFYPRLRMGDIFVFLEVKPGFDAYVSDFHLLMSLKYDPADKIRLLVVQTDNIETSSCLVSPAKVNFLVNGKAVESRTNLFMDTGPQVPTVVKSLLKYGSNILQAVGDFNGNYIIIVAFMNEVQNPDSSSLQNYEQHAPATVDADSEVIEGPSRISLNCPISLKRIKTPVKGISCKHIQCFDFSDYVDINSRRPSWRCPHCNQSVCFSDIRIDQKMVKILKEVGPKVSDIIVNSDGSWNAVMENEETAEKPVDKTSNTGRQGESPQPGDVLDLTQIDDPMDVIDACEAEDRKHSLIDNAQPHQNNRNDVNQSSDSHIENDFWTGIYMSTFGHGSPNVRPNVQTTGTSASTSNLTDPFSSGNSESVALHHNAFTTASAVQTGTALPSTLQYQIGNSPAIGEYSRPSVVPKHITRTATAVQALPAQTQASVLQRRASINGARPFTPSGLSAASQASPAVPNLATNLNSPHHVPSIPSSSPSLPHSNIQIDNDFLDANQVPNMCRVSNEHHNSNPPSNFGIPLTPNQSPGLIQSSVQSSPGLLHPLSHSGVSQDRSHIIATANRAVHMSIGATRTYSWNTDAHNMTAPAPPNRATPPSQPVTRTDAQSSAYTDWRPTVRMRGALAGQAYNEALNLIITQPSQQLAQTARPTSNGTPLPNNVRPNFPTFMAGGHIQAVQVANSVSAPIGRPTGAETLPNASSEMH